MSEPIVEQIALWLVDALTDITIGNGYQQTLTVSRPGELFDDSDTLADLSTIVAIEDPESVGPRTTAGRRWRQPFTIATFLLGAAGTALSTDTRINRVRSDIEKVLGTEQATAAGPGSICNSLADDIQINAPQILTDPETQAVLLISNVSILYGVSAASPYTQT